MGVILLDKEIKNLPKKKINKNLKKKFLLIFFFTIDNCVWILLPHVPIEHVDVTGVYIVDHGTLLQIGDNRP